MIVADPSPSQWFRLNACPTSWAVERRNFALSELTVLFFQNPTKAERSFVVPAAPAYILPSRPVFLQAAPQSPSQK